eukprot:Clim_evm181s157 gene=Clim_evmTU181s157
MADIINIGGDASDQFFRYKMPKVTVKWEGRGNGTKTVLSNIEDVARCLERPPSYPTKFFGCELGTTTKINEEDSKYIINGHWPAEELQKLIDVFIKKFVLCGSCNNPETTMKIDKNGNISMKCKACGATTPVDMVHRLSQFIVKNPPEGAGKKGKKDKAARKAAKAAAKKGKAVEEDNDDEKGEENGEVNGLPGDVEAPEMKEVGDVEWSVDVSEEAVRERQRDVSGAVASMTMTDDAEKPLEQRLEIFQDFVKSKDKSVKDIVDEAKRLDVFDPALLVLGEIYFSENFIQELKDNKALIRQFTLRSAKAARNLLVLMELLCKEHPGLLEKVSQILHTMYDEEILTEEHIEYWANKKSKRNVGKEMSKKIHENATTFLQWLEEAESESEDEAEDEAEDEGDVPPGGDAIAFGDGDNEADDVANGGDADDDDEDEDDIDIDDI